MNNTSISIEAIARVSKPYRHISTRVDQTNILLGTGARVRGVPRLEIATDDIEGATLVKFIVLVAKPSFYLTTQGLSEQSAETLLLNSEILRHIRTIEGDKREEICREIHTRLIKNKMNTIVQLSVFIKPQDKRRIDLYLSHIFPYFSRSYINTLIENGNVQVNNKPLEIGKRLRLRDTIDIQFTTEKYYLDGENIPLEIILILLTLLLLAKILESIHIHFQDNMEKPEHSSMRSSITLANSAISVA